MNQILTLSCLCDSVQQLYKDFPTYGSAPIKNAFKETFFYAPTYFAFQKLIDNGAKLDKLKIPRIVDPAAPNSTRSKRARFSDELNEAGVPVGEPALDDELDREIAWVKRKLS